jgi:predicted nucleic acid-binding protein
MIILDSNIWIFAENAHSEEHELATQKLRQLLNSTTFGVNAIITSEVYHKLSKLIGSEEASYRTTNILEHPSAQWLEFSPNIALDAIKLSKEKSIRINDAMIAQQALSFKASILTDNVKDFKKVNGLKILPLR